MPNGFFQLEIEGLSEGSLRMQAFAVDETLHRTYRVVVDAVARGPLVIPPLLGNKATLRVVMPDVERCFHGMLWSVDQQPVAPERVHLQLVVVPRLAALELGCDSRLWTDKTLQEVVADVLKHANIPDQSIDWQASPGPIHANIVQRNESDLTFIERLLSEAGIGYIVQNDFDEERIIFFDNADSFLPVENVPRLVNRESTSYDIDSVFGLREQVSARTDRVILRDYDVDRPATPPEDGDAVEEPVGHAYYLHGAGHTQLRGLAERVLQRLRTDARTISAGSYTPMLEPGRRLPIEHDRRDALTEELLLVSVNHRGRMAGQGTEYENRFTAIPWSTAYRPQLLPEPIAAGVQRAFVTGPQNAELHADSQGRVRVKLAWDRSDRDDDRSSTWLRVGQLQLPGSMVVPRVGFEVQVSSEQSDMDRPAVTGHYYNQEQPPPYGGQATISSYQTATTDRGGGSNELRIDDTAGSEEILLNASFDLTCAVGHDAAWTITNNETVEIGVNHVFSVVGDLVQTIGAARTMDVGADETINVTSDCADGVGGDLSLTIGAARLETVGGDQVDSVKGTLDRTIGAAQLMTGVIGVKRKVVGNSDATVGAAWVEMVSDNRVSDVGATRKETVGALKWIKAKNKLLATTDDLVETVASQSVTAGAVRSDNAEKDLTIEIKNATKLKGKNMNFTASDKLTLSIGGCTIELSKTGKIKVKGKKIILKNAKELAQVLYKGN